MPVLEEEAKKRQATSGPKGHASCLAAVELGVGETTVRETGILNKYHGSSTNGDSTATWGAATTPGAYGVQIWRNSGRSKTISNRKTPESGGRNT